MGGEIFGTGFKKLFSKLNSTGTARIPKHFAPKLYPANTSRLKISPGSHSTTTSNGRQQTSQSVVNRCDGTLVSMMDSNDWPQ